MFHPSRQVLAIPLSIGKLISFNQISFLFSLSFSGQTISSKSFLLITVQLNIPESIINLTLNSDRIVLATMLLTDIKQTLSTV